MADLHEPLARIVFDDIGVLPARDTVLQEIGYGSLEVITIMLACEEEFGIEVTDKDFDIFMGPFGKLVDEITRRVGR